MKERIKKLRKALDLTQQEFADRLGISRGNIATYETRDGNPGDAVISLICREFNVSEAWLRTGEGEMFIKQTRNEEIAAFMDSILCGGSDFRQQFISVLTRMTTEEWAMLEKKALELLEEVQKTEAGKKAAQEKAAFMKMADSQYDLEEGPDTPASSASGSGAG